MAPRSRIFDSTLPSIQANNKAIPKILYSVQFVYGVIMLTSGLGRSSTTGGAVITAAKTLETHRIASGIRDGQFECRLYLPSNPPQCTALLPSPETKS